MLSDSAFSTKRTELSQRHLQTNHFLPQYSIMMSLHAGEDVVRTCGPKSESRIVEVIQIRFDSIR